MNINILRYSLFSIAGGQEVDRNFPYIFVKLDGLIAAPNAFSGLLKKYFLDQY